ncbi:hypothetical protein GQ464_008625 [Rhodocaloribacter litoris]|uniref:hypothetical protein n=1 Tax=Rhodocaloribacter litoris TaxID=2558931 RepID=UPI001420D602|nr:hypothetical protein [Rhodocaloribacter litoris]QXD16981.1 hypothetical protein GQ464_008625 [Rhodocaloribacter litoris]
MKDAERLKLLMQDAIGELLLDVKKVRVILHDAEDVLFQNLTFGGKMKPEEAETDPVHLRIWAAIDLLKLIETRCLETKARAAGEDA